MQGQGYKPAEAANALGVPASTLRLYSVRFGSLLSATAARPVERAGGKPGFRVYTEQDLAVLREGKALLERGLTYEEALQQLKRRWRPRVLRRQEAAAEPTLAGEAPEAVTAEPTPLEPSGASAATSAAHGEREATWGALVAHLMASLNSAQALAEEWRRIVEERNAELATLRERLRDAEERARAPWWRRLFGG